MKNFTMPYNYTNINQMVSYADQITHMDGTATGGATGVAYMDGTALFLWFLMIMVFTVTFLAFSRYPKQQAFAVASFATLFTSIMFMVPLDAAGLPLAKIEHIVIALAVAILAVAWLYTGEKQ